MYQIRGLSATSLHNGVSKRFTTCDSGKGYENPYYRAAGVVLVFRNALLLPEKHDRGHRLHVYNMRPTPSGHLDP